jgi:hypothetical protein
MEKWRYLSNAYRRLRALLQRMLGRRVPRPQVAPAPPPRALLTQLLAGQGRSARLGWQAAADALVQHANACLPLVQEALTHEVGSRPCHAWRRCVPAWPAQPPGSC